MAICIRKSSNVRLINLTISLGDGYVKRSGEATLYIIIYFGRLKVKLNTKVSVPVNDWDTERNCVKPTNPYAKDMNMIIGSCLSRINDIYIRYRLEGEDLTPNLLRKEYKKPSVFPGFFRFMRSAIEERRGEITDTSIRTALRNL